MNWASEFPHQARWLSHKQIKVVLFDLYGVSVSRATICRALARLGMKRRRIGCVRLHGREYIALDVLARQFHYVCLGNYVYRGQLSTIKIGGGRFATREAVEQMIHET